jgi:hypothetical protein
VLQEAFQRADVLEGAIATIVLELKYSSAIGFVCVEYATPSTFTVYKDPWSYVVG